MAILTPKSNPISFSLFGRKITLGAGETPNPAIGAMGLTVPLNLYASTAKIAAASRLARVYSWFGRRSWKAKAALAASVPVTAEVLTGREVTKPFVDKGVGAAAGFFREAAETTGEIIRETGEQIIYPSIDTITESISNVKDEAFSTIGFGRNEFDPLADTSGGEDRPAGDPPPRGLGFGAVVGAGLAAAFVIVGIGLALRKK